MTEPLWRCRNCHHWEQKEGDEIDGWCMRALAKAYASYTCPVFKYKTEEWDP
jgi:hypothetical protein